MVAAAVKAGAITKVQRAELVRIAASFGEVSPRSLGLAIAVLRSGGLEEAERRAAPETRAELSRVRSSVDEWCSSVETRAVPVCTRDGKRTDNACAPKAARFDLAGVGGWLGGRTEIVVEDSTGLVRLPARWALLPVGALLTSHDPLARFAPRPGYPSQLQERDYERGETEQAKVRSAAGNLYPELLLSDNRDALTGAPIVDRQRRVLGGNGRAMALALHFAETGPQNRYAPALARELRCNVCFGLFGAPLSWDLVLVRVLDRVDDVLAISRQLNAPLSAAMTRETEAFSLGQRLSDRTIGRIGDALADDETASEAIDRLGRELVRDLISDGVITPTQRPAWLQTLGGEVAEKLNRSGKERVIDAIVALSVRDVRVIRDAGPSVAQLLAQLAPVVIRFDRWDPANLAGYNWAPAYRRALPYLVATQDFARDLSLLRAYWGTRQLFDEGPGVGLSADTLKADPEALCCYWWLLSLLGRPKVAADRARRTWIKVPRELRGEKGLYELRDRLEIAEQSEDPWSVRELAGWPSQVAVLDLGPNAAIGELTTRRIETGDWDRAVAVFNNEIDERPSAQAIRARLIDSWRPQVVPLRSLSKRAEEERAALVESLRPVEALDFELLPFEPPPRRSAKARPVREARPWAELRAAGLSLSMAKKLAALGYRDAASVRAALESGAPIEAFGKSRRAKLRVALGLGPEPKPERKPRAKREKLTGGRADAMPDRAFDAVELARGEAHEREHTSDRQVAREIAKDHLAEDPAYYEKLEAMEAEGNELPAVDALAGTGARRARLEARQERREEWAGKAQARSDAAFETAHQVAGRFELGQPILVGHHSEKKARADQRRMHAAMDRAVGESKLAEHHAQRAAGLERQLDRSIFADDVDAIPALRARIEQLKSEHAKRVELNAAARKLRPKPKNRAEMVAAIVGAGLIPASLSRVYLTGSVSELDVHPHPTWELQNGAAQIRRNEDRLATIIKTNEKFRSASSAGGVLFELVAGDQIRITFAAKPDRSTIEELKAARFRWSSPSWIGPFQALPPDLRKQYFGSSSLTPRPSHFGAVPLEESERAAAQQERESAAVKRALGLVEYTGSEEQIRREIEREEDSLSGWNGAYLERLKLERDQLFAEYLQKLQDEAEASEIEAPDARRLSDQRDQLERKLELLRKRELDEAQRGGASLGLAIKASQREQQESAAELFERMAADSAAKVEAKLQLNREAADAFNGQARIEPFSPAGRTERAQAINKMAAGFRSLYRLIARQVGELFRDGKVNTAERLQGLKLVPILNELRQLDTLWIWLEYDKASKILPSDEALAVESEAMGTVYAWNETIRIADEEMSEAKRANDARVRRSIEVLEEQPAYEASPPIDRETELRLARQNPVSWDTAHRRIMDELERRGWTVSARTLKTPWAESPNGRRRFWFKSQAILQSGPPPHNLGDARSTFMSDQRTLPVDEVLRRLIPETELRELETPRAAPAPVTTDRTSEGRVKVRVSSGEKQSNAGWYRSGKQNWWLKGRDAFEQIPRVRGDKEFSEELWLQPGAYILGVGRSGKDSIRQTIQVGDEPSEAPTLQRQPRGAGRQGSGLSLTCPTCKRPGVLTRYQASQGHQCDRCADRDEGSYAS